MIKSILYCIKKDQKINNYPDFHLNIKNQKSKKNEDIKRKLKIIFVFGTQTTAFDLF